MFATAHLFVDVQVAHPLLMAAFMILMAVTFCLFGFIIGIWAQSFEQLQVIPLLVVYPLTFLGGAFYSLDMLPAAWRTVTLFRSDERRVGQECVSTCRSRWSPYH